VDGVHGDAGRKVGHVYAHALHGVMLSDHFKFASYGPTVSMVCVIRLSRTTWLHFLSFPLLYTVRKG